MKFLFPLFLCFWVTSSFAQDNEDCDLQLDESTVHKLKALPLPTFSYSPETSVYIGAVCLFTKKSSDSLTRTSSAKTKIGYSFNKQLIFESIWSYFSTREKWFSEGRLHYSMYADQYFGVGVNQTVEDRVFYQSDRIIAEVSGLRKVNKNWFLGPQFRYQNHYNFRLEEMNDSYSELQKTSTIGLGLTVQNDTRDNLFAPSKGHLLKVSNSHNYGGGYYTKISLDARKYYSFGKDSRHTISGRAFSSHTIGETPFYDLSLIGGDKFVRGYFFGRFRDQHLSTVQTEYRTHLFWRIGVAAFGGASLVYNNFDSADFMTVKPNLGAGLRILTDKENKINLRLDYAIGLDGESGFYVVFGESF